MKVELFIFCLSIKLVISCYDFNCITCVPNFTNSNSRYCIQCNLNTSLDTTYHTCVEYCPDGQYPQNIQPEIGTSQYQCKKCPQNCTSCIKGTYITTGVYYFPICTVCNFSGPTEYFLYNGSCNTTCPINMVQNRFSHKCQKCPTVGYFNDTSSTPNNCTLCHPACKICTDGTNTQCSKCRIGYYLYYNQTICNKTCPFNQYASLLDDQAKCYPCSAVPPDNCRSCINSSTTCTVCTPNNNVWLYNYKCIGLCPDGYEGNNTNFQCELCLLGTYSFQNKCYSWCPEYYTANDNIRACVLSGGYPLQMSVEIEGPEMLKFTIPLPLGLEANNITNLLTNWQTQIILSYFLQTNSVFTSSISRLLQNIGNILTINNALIANDSIILYCNSVSPDILIRAVSFSITLRSNLFSQNNNIMYKINSMNLTTSTPWIIRQIFDLNLPPFFIIAIFLAIICLFPLLMKIQYSYRILIQYMQSLQLVGLTYFVIYPYVSSIILYSFVKGFDYINFSFMFNVPANFIKPCINYISLTSYAFVMGDMDWLRLIGSLLLCLIAILLCCFVISLFQCSKVYAKFFLALMVDLVAVKSLHCWFASLVYSGLNIRNYQQSLDFYIVVTHMLSYCLIVFLLYVGYRCHEEYRYPHVSQLFLTIFIMLETVISVAPTLMCSLLLFISFVQFGVSYAIQFIKESKQQKQKKYIKKMEVESLKSVNSSRFHYFLLRSMRPITGLMISSIVMINRPMSAIIVVSVVYFVVFMLVLVDLFVYYKFIKSQQKEKVMPQNRLPNLTREDLKHQVSSSSCKEEGHEKNAGITIIDIADCADDEFVENKFSKNNLNKSLSDGFRENKIHMKNFD